MKKNIVIGVASIVIAFGAIIGLAKACAPKSDVSQEAVSTQKVAKQKKNKTKKHPKLSPIEKDLTLRVSLEGNRTYLLRKGKVIYTMLSSGGIYKKGKSLTPTGTYTIQAGRGDSFFNYELNEGANNWTSWSPDNVYLFHSVPTKADGNYNMKEAAKLGRTQGSHGCIRLSVPDSKWLMDNIPDGTKVVIKDR